MDAPGLGETSPGGGGGGRGAFGPSRCGGTRAVPVCGVGKAGRCVLLAQGADVPDEMFGRFDIADVRVELAVVVVSGMWAEVLKGALDGWLDVWTDFAGVIALGSVSHLKSDPNWKCWTTGNLDKTSALYILIMPCQHISICAIDMDPNPMIKQTLLIFAQPAGTPEMS